MKMPQRALAAFPCLGGGGGEEGPEAATPSPTVVEVRPVPEIDASPEVEMLMTQLAAELGLLRRFVRVGPVTYHYVQKGEGPVIVFLHGVPQFWGEWRHQIEGLGGEMSVAAVDPQGF